MYQTEHIKRDIEIIFREQTFTTEAQIKIPLWDIKNCTGICPWRPAVLSLDAKSQAISPKTGHEAESSLFDNHYMDKMNVNRELKEEFVMCGEFGDASFSIFNTVSLFSHAHKIWSKQ